MTTGRPRRCGWFDAVVVRYSAMICGLTDLCITKLDIFDKLKEIKICVGYELNGEKTDRFPSTTEEIAACKPIYETMPGWQQDTMGIRKFEDLPVNAQKYIKRLEELCDIPVSVVAVGPDRTQTIVRNPLF